MKNEEENKKNHEGVVKAVFREIRESIILEVMGQIILFIPKMIIRIIRNY